MRAIVPVLAILFISCFTPAHQQSDEETDSLPLTPSFASIEIVEQSNAICPHIEAQNIVKNSLQPLIPSTIDIVTPCTQRVKGLFPHCPANNCTELFNLVQEAGLMFLSNYYWLVGTTGVVRKVYCDRNTNEPEYASCEDLFDLYNLPSGTYTLHPSRNSPVTVYCDMNKEECGGGVWTRIASYNFSDLSISCPPTWAQMISPVRGCSVITSGCVSTSFASLVEFSGVCGKVIGIQYDDPQSFDGPGDIDSTYVDGVSITHGSPRQHIWTFAAYSYDDDDRLALICPCSQPSLNVPPPPSFVGNNYFCDTGAEILQEGWHVDDPLWDGQGCSSTSTCCSFNNPPWFSTTLPQSTTDDIEVRICHNHPAIGDNPIVVMLDLYIK